MLINKPVGKIEIIKNSVNRIQLSPWFNEVYSNPEEFIVSRINIIHRENIQNICKVLGINTLEEYANITNCISATDSFWLCNVNNQTSWDKVNAYTNPINIRLANAALNGVYDLHGNDLKSPSPQYRIAGSADKCIKRIHSKDGLYLYKSSGDIAIEPTHVRPYSEYFAYQVAEKLGIKNAVAYDIHEHTTEDGFIKPYCICKIFTNENRALVDFCDSIYKNKTLLEIAQSSELATSKENILNMLILDSIIINFDRHSANYGFILDNEQGKLTEFAPIFDNDCSLGSFDSVKEDSFEELYNNVMRRQPKTGLGSYNEQALASMYPAMYKKLKSLKYLKLRKGKAKGISQLRFDFIEYLVNRRIKEIVALVDQTYHLN